MGSGGARRPAGSALAATGAATGPVVHRVSRLDQLDEPAGRSLYLLSVRAVSDASGTDSLDPLIDRARTAAAATGTGACTALLADRLAALDVLPTDVGRYSEPLRIVGAELCEVRNGFPRLVPSAFPQGLPVGVSDVAYHLDMSACGSWLLAREPSDTGVLAALSA